MDEFIPAPGPAADQPVSNQAPDATGEKKRKKKKERVRSAWISFVGRILAQFIGAAATIGLGVLIVQRAQSPAPPPSRESEDKGPTVARVQSTRAGGEVSIAVLPLNNFSQDPQQEYFADGMTEALITDLAKIDGLRVISRTSSMYYKRHRKSLPEIARELGVDAIVEGSVARSGDRVRITAQLIDGKSDEHLWGDSYERPTRDVLALQRSPRPSRGRSTSPCPRDRKPASRLVPPLIRRRSTCI